MSPDGRIKVPMGTPSIGRDLSGHAGACGLQQNVAQPRCIAPPKTKGLTEHPGLVPASWMRRVQAIVLDFANIEDCLIAVRQTRRHGGRVASDPVLRKSQQRDPGNNGKYLDIQS